MKKEGLQFMYCSMTHMLTQAKADRLGVPAFNIHALEVVPMMARRPLK